MIPPSFLPHQPVGSESSWPQQEPTRPDQVLVLCVQLQTVTLTSRLARGQHLQALKGLFFIMEQGYREGEEL